MIDALSQFESLFAAWKAVVLYLQTKGRNSLRY
jgi:hypothetical protein